MAVGKRKTQQARRATALGAAVLLTFAASVGVAINASNGLPGQSRTVAYAAFDDVGALRAGDDIRIAGVRVGQVGDIRLDGDHAVVELKFDGDRPIYRGSKAVTASVGARSALGQKYVAFTPGDPASGTLPDGATIPATKTSGAQDLSDLISVFDDPTRQALGSTVRQLGGGVAGHSQDLNDALRALPAELPDLGTVSSALASRSADVTAMLRTVDQFAARFQGRQQQLSDLTGQLGTTLGAVATDGGQPLADTLKQTPDTLRQAREALKNLQGPLADTQQAVRVLQPGATALGQATPDLRGVLREGVPPLNKLPGVDAQAVPAVTDLTQVFADARPLAPEVTGALHDAAPLVQTLAPYAPEIAMWFTYADGALSDGDAAGHWLRIYPLLGTESVTGAPAGVRDPLTVRDPYPAPGQAAQDKKGR
ncbi:MCE family protein [Amycolatopsis sp. K13G38]|uniref:MCE family protein n=1 Tax=Amycolatopsis acididurans TaxID=2724524 RepID=A0ABX1JD69_9PSEU|nr:MlaD family protein [Amycolatopsis acididurans]NKQ57737.1 MCE family protein [Amycolatopsis acididurans]